MEKTTRTTIMQEEGYRFRVGFDEPSMPALITDEPAPLGKGAGPNPGRLLAAAIGNCLAASLLFCLEKAHVNVRGVDAVVDMTIGRNEQGRLRVRSVTVRVAPTVAPEDRERMGRCLELFESFCTVTESIRQGIDVKVNVEAAGN